MSIEKKKPTKEFYSALDDVITHQIKSRVAFDKAIEIGRKQGYDDFTIGLFIKDYLKDKIPKTSLYRYLKEINPNSVPMEQIYYNNVLEANEHDIQKYEDEAVNAIVEREKTRKKLESLLKESVPKRAKMLVESHERYKNGDPNGWKGPINKISSKIKDDFRLKGANEEALELIDKYLSSEYKESVSDILKDAVTEIREVEKNLLDAAKTFEGKGYTKEKIIAEIIRECKLEGFEEIDLKYIDRFLHSELN